LAVASGITCCRCKDPNLGFWDWNMWVFWQQVVGIVQAIIGFITIPSSFDKQDEEDVPLQAYLQIVLSVAGVIFMALLTFLQDANCVGCLRAMPCCKHLAVQQEDGSLVGLMEREFFLQTWQKQYISAAPPDHGGKVSTAAVPQMWEVFNLEFAGEPKRYTLRTKHGTYLTARDNDEVVVDAHDASLWEMFEFERADDLEGKDDTDDWYFLKTCHGKYLQAHCNGSINASGSGPRKWEGFKLVENRR